MRNPKLKQYIHLKVHKDPALSVNIEDILFLDPVMLSVIGAAAMYFADEDLPFVITSLTEGVHKSMTHEQGRGCDVRIHDPKGKWELSVFHRERLCFHLNELYAKDFGTGPIGASPKVAIAEPDHIHLQVRRRL